MKKNRVSKIEQAMDVWKAFKFREPLSHWTIMMTDKLDGSWVVEVMEDTLHDTATYEGEADDLALAIMRAIERAKGK